MNERISELTLIPNARDPIPGGDKIADRPVMRAQIGTAGTDWFDREFHVAVDATIEDPTTYAAVIVNGIEVLELEKADAVRALAAKLLEAADVMDAAQ